jgi:hypothetical protein
MGLSVLFGLSEKLFDKLLDSTQKSNENPKANNKKD